MEKENILNPAAEGLKVLVVYDDVCSGIEARDFCDRLAHKLEPPGEPTVSFWSLAALEFPDLAQMAAEEAKEADLLIVAVNRSGWLRPSIKMWFSQWVRRTPGDATAAGAPPRGVLGTGLDLSPAYDRLKQLALGAGVDFFAEVVESNRENLNGLIDAIHPRTRMAPPLPEALQLPGNKKNRDDYD